MERRVLLAIFLSFLVLYVYQSFVVKPAPKPLTAGPTAAGRPSAAPLAPPPTALVPTPQAEAATPAGVVGDAGERDVRVETRDIVAVFTNRGARLKSWRLKHFLDPKSEPLELVANELATTQPLPFSLRVDDE